MVVLKHRNAWSERVNFIEEVLQVPHVGTLREGMKADDIDQRRSVRLIQMVRGESPYCQGMQKRPQMPIVRRKERTR